MRCRVGWWKYPLTATSLDCSWPGHPPTTSWPGPLRLFVPPRSSADLRRATSSIATVVSVPDVTGRESHLPCRSIRALSHSRYDRPRCQPARADDILASHTRRLCAQRLVPSTLSHPARVLSLLLLARLRLFHPHILPRLQPSALFQTAPSAQESAPHSHPCPPSSLRRLRRQSRERRLASESRAAARSSHRLTRCQTRTGRASRSAAVAVPALSSG